MNIHPKTSGAAVGGALGIVIVGVLESIHGLDLAGQLPAAIPTFLALLGSWLAPGDNAPEPPVTPVTGNPQLAVALSQRSAELDAREKDIAAREAAK